MSTMRWSEAVPSPAGGGGPLDGALGGVPATPQIKNHSVTHHRGHLYCFGGYDGRRNHQTLLIYSLREGRWLLPSPAGGMINLGDGPSSHFTVRGVPPPGRNGHTATLATGGRRSRRRRHRMNNLIYDEEGEIGLRGEAPLPRRNSRDPPSSAEVEVRAALNDLAVAMDAMDAELGTEREAGNVNAQGGEDDALDNPNEDQASVEGGNGDNPTEEEDDEDAQIIIIGGWLGSGPLAASDMWVLDISGGLDRLRWFQPPTLGTPPGPCNMHSADFIPSRGEVYVFRGGNGREYLNDLHALDVESYVWRTVETHGEAPQQRANHSSALLEKDGVSELFVFGGWNGSERLNDIHVLDTATSTWSTPRVLGVKPHPRAGMTLTALRGRLYLFGGSGTSSKCFDDLQVLDREEMAWLDVNDQDEEARKERECYDSTWMVNRGATVGGGSGYSSNANRQASSSWEMLGGQDGSNSGGIKFADWRSYGGYQSGANNGPISGSANPNDEDTVPSVYVNGKPPGRRAGHTATAVGKHIYVFGGSCGTDYLNDFFVLDTDPPPLMKVTEPPSPQLYASRLRHFCDNAEFSDVTFLVEGQTVYGHKLVLSTVSDCFRAMFMAGFRESGSEKAEIEIPNCSYDSFVTMMEYIYSGVSPRIDVFSVGGMDRAIALLELADQFFLYNLKENMEGALQPAVNRETHAFLRQVAQKTNATQLESFCQYFERNMHELVE
ncbi:hypothetical protein ACHAXT_012263 [Thalassiosira profunda]